MPDKLNPNDDPKVAAAVQAVEDLVDSLTAEEIVGELQCFGANLVDQLDDDPVIRLGVATMVKMVKRLDSDIEGHTTPAVAGVCLHQVDGKPIVGETLNGIVNAMREWQLAHLGPQPTPGGYL